jgi:hypothetical protein
MGGQMRTCEEITCNYTGTELYACPSCEKQFCYQHQTTPDASWHKCKPVNDGTAGHSKGDWYASVLCAVHAFGRDQAIATIGISNKKEEWATCHLIALAQHTPHDCGDPECPGVVNKRKLELYDKFQTAINEFAKAGLLT